MLLVYGIGLLIAGLFLINAIFSYQSKHIDPAFWTTIWFQVKMIPLFFAANVMIGFGIKYNYKSTGSLTFALSLSKGFEIFIVVLMGYLFLKEVPTWKTWVGLSLVIGGFVITRLK
ncbi:hypothetical protein [Paenibacillus turpanensis]|uniref:hypothetical protein n=1 Tax=Paenibacillus turpanensis TaxID=2689078 RepID=UPI00140B73F7|nr:hypothetical protein [Paenibacillus turpanensis]